MRRKVGQSSWSESADALTWGDTFYQFAVAYHQGSFHEDVLKAFGELAGFFVRGFVDDAVGVKDSDVGVGTHFQAPFVAHLRGHVFEALRGEE